MVNPAKAVTERSISTPRRLVAALAMLPIVPATAIVATGVSRRYFAVSAFDEIRWYHLWLAVGWVGATVFIWRSMVLWTLGRTWLTALVGLVPFAQVVYAQPIWNAGCGGDDVLRVGQGNVGIGAWVWLLVWVWWGWEREYAMRTEGGQAYGREVTVMSPTAKRLVCAIASLPVAFGCFMIAVVVMESLGLSGDRIVMLAVGISAVLACVMWCAIWRRSVQWSGATIFRTAVLAVVCMGIPIAAGYFLMDMGYGFWSDVCGAFPVIGWGVWMIATLRAWPMLSTVGVLRVETIRCRRCGYLLTGLTATRCPECGDEPTIDELWCANIYDEI